MGFGASPLRPSMTAPPTVSSALARPQVALGLLPLAIEGRPPESSARSVVEAAADAGVRLVDTADVYGVAGEEPGYAERLLAPLLRRPALAGRLIVATKGGLVRHPDGGRYPDGSPAHLRAACEASLRRLGIDAIDLYQLHRPDPAVPIEESLGAMVELLERGLVRSLGVSNVSAADVSVARRVAGDRLVAVQNELRPGGPDEVVTLRPFGVAFLGWGLFGGVEAAASLGARLPGAGAVAVARGVSVHRIVAAWAVARGAIPVVGARRSQSIVDSAAAVTLAPDLSQHELSDISPSPVPVADRAPVVDRAGDGPAG